VGLELLILRACGDADGAELILIWFADADFLLFVLAAGEGFSWLTPAFEAFEGCRFEAGIFIICVSKS
jgi:hypothetical protein